MSTIPDLDTRVARLEGAFEQMNKRLARIEAELLIVIGAMISVLITLLVKRIVGDRLHTHATATSLR